MTACVFWHALSAPLCLQRTSLANWTGACSDAQLSPDLIPSHLPIYQTSSKKSVGFGAFTEEDMAKSPSVQDGKKQGAGFF